MTSLSGCTLNLGFALVRGRYHVHDAMRMREHLEAVRPCDRHQRDAGLIGGFKGKCGRYRDSRNDGRTGNRSLLHHLDRHAARQEYDALVDADTFPAQTAYKLIESI